VLVCYQISYCYILQNYWIFVRENKVFIFPNNELVFKFFCAQKKNLSDHVFESVYGRPVVAGCMYYHPAFPKIGLTWGGMEGGGEHNCYSNYNNKKKVNNNTVDPFPPLGSADRHVPSFTPSQIEAYMLCAHNKFRRLVCDIRSLLKSARPSTVRPCALSYIIIWCTL
jgi:hypothetical protein